MKAWSVSSAKTAGMRTEDHPLSSRPCDNQDEWILRVIASPEREYAEADGRVRRSARIDEMECRYLRVILLPDRETVHNAFFDRGYQP